MLAESKNAKLYTKLLADIRSEEVRDAFRYIVGCAATLGSLICHPQRKGVIHDFRFMDTEHNEQPFSFIPNKKWLLFYFRKPAIQSRRYTFSLVQAAFSSASKNNGGEWTVKLKSIEDVQRLWQLLSID